MHLKQAMWCSWALCLSLVSAGMAAEPVDFSLPDGFLAEQIYEVPKKDQGSWICLAVDNQGRLISSDQSGALYRLTPSDPPVVEKIDLDIGRAMGLLVHRDALYVMVNGRAASGPGLYRVRDIDGDDTYDSVELLRGIDPPGNPGAGHGNHAIVLGPDEESLYLVCGNMAGWPVGGFDSSRVPELWGEDQLLPRLPDSRGHASSTMAPGGWIAKTDLDGKKWELVCVGFRNVYDAAFNRQGDLFTFDADMEFDLGTPWYRPTRVCHVVSGGEFGWRNGSGKWPSHYPDSLPSVFDVGLGSPTGMTFGYQTKFPDAYRESLFLCDWSYGRIYSAQLARHDGSYRGTHKLFASFAPLPVVDLVANPLDGAMYLVTGGRNVQSHVYRIRYAADENLATDDAHVAKTAEANELSTKRHSLRQRLEGFHSKHANPHVPSEVWLFLQHEDRAIRFAARVVLEHQPPSSWVELLSEETHPQTIMEACIALSRLGDQRHRQLVMAKLESLELDGLTDAQKLAWTRAISLAFIRLGRPAETKAAQLGEHLSKRFPSGDSLLDRELSRLLVYLQADGAIDAILSVRDSANSTDDQMHYSAMLRLVEHGWSIEQRKRYFRWFASAESFVGGRSNGDFVRQIREAAMRTLSTEEKEELSSFFDELEKSGGEATQRQRPFVRQWKLNDLSSLAGDWQQLLQRENNASDGAQLFADAKCATCHQVNGRGGRIGPNLTGIARRFSPRDLLKAILDPSETIPHEFQAVTVALADGRSVSGQVVNFSKHGMSLRTNPLEPWRLTRVRLEDIEETVPSKVSLMPSGLLDNLKEDEIAELMAWMYRESESN